MTASANRHRRSPGRAALSDREATLAEFRDYLRTVNNRDGRPFEEKTISVYCDPPRNPDRWTTAGKTDGDFTAAGTALLNRYSRDYYLHHGQGGTHTAQRNPIQLLNFPEHERGPATPDTDALGARRSRDGRRHYRASSPATCSRSPAAARRGTSRPPAITRSSPSRAARAPGGRNRPAWPCTPCRPT